MCKRSCPGECGGTTPQQRAHPDFPLRAFVRCESCGRGLTGSGSNGDALAFEVTLREGAAGTGLQVAFEADGSLLGGEFDGDVDAPRTITRGVGAAAGVVVGEAGTDVGREADVEVRLGIRHS